MQSASSKPNAELTGAPLLARPVERLVGQIYVLEAPTSSLPKPVFSPPLYVEERKTQPPLTDNFPVVGKGVLSAEIPIDEVHCRRYQTAIKV